jgi:predicted O-methyltransferase YrrM
VKRLVHRFTQWGSKYLPSSREIWLISIAWHISAVFLFLSLSLRQDFPEIGLLALFLAVYVHVVVNRRLTERRLKAHNRQEDSRRKRDIKKLRDDLTTHIDTTTQTVSRLNLSVLEKLRDELTIDASSIAFLLDKIAPNEPIEFRFGYAASPKLLSYLYGEIRKRRPAFVLDLGSGLSTIVAAHALRQNGEGFVIAVDHEKKYADRTRQVLEQHDLHHFSEVREAVLTEFQLDKGVFSWYGNVPRKPPEIDILIVDGPPGKTGHLARYPAMPILQKSLANNALVIVDDARRADEAEMIQQWKHEFGELQLLDLGEYSHGEFVALQFEEKSR